MGLRPAELAQELQLNRQSSAATEHFETLNSSNSTVVKRFWNAKSWRVWSDQR